MYLKKVYILEVPGNSLADVLPDEDSATRAGVRYGTRHDCTDWHISEGWMATTDGVTGYLVESTLKVTLPPRRVPAMAV